MTEARVSQVGVLVVYVVDESTDDQRGTQAGALVAYVEEPPEPTPGVAGQVVWID